MAPTGVVALDSDNSAGASVAPGNTFVYPDLNFPDLLFSVEINVDFLRYKWYVPPRAGPTPNDPSSILWFYRSTVNEGSDILREIFLFSLFTSIL